MLILNSVSAPSLCCMALPVDAMFLHSWTLPDMKSRMALPRPGGCGWGFNLPNHHREV